MEAPPQQTQKPSYHPYNQLHRPRRLDYVLVRNIPYVTGGKVEELRHVVACDHDAVTMCTRVGHRAEKRTPDRIDLGHGPKQLREPAQVRAVLSVDPPTSGDMGRQIQQTATALVERKRNYRAFQESQQLKQLRRSAIQTRDKTRAREMWKQMWKMRTKEKEQWHKDLLQAALAEDWQALRAVKAARRKVQWEEALTTQPDWESTMQTHFEGIFAKQPPEQVEVGIREVWDALTRTCKNTRWRPFSREELLACAAAWSGGKSTGPDGISYEALKQMGMHEKWASRIREEFNDALYKGRCSPLTKKSITILLPKERQPTEWGQTRPITLSSSLLKWQAQLLLGRVGEAIMGQARYQFARPGRQATELILLLRRAVRVSKEWDIPFHVAKVDVSEAFDTVSQPELAKTIQAKLSPKGMAWEARLWVDLVENRSLQVCVQGQPRPVQQTNGVRQGCPDSPVIFASVIADALNETLAQQAEPGTGPARAGYSPDRGPPLPHHGAGFQHDIYLCALHRPYLQALLDRLASNLAFRNLHMHPSKTKCIHTSPHKHTLQVAGKEVQGEHMGTITVLGAPVTMKYEVLACLAEISRQARAAFAVHRKMMAGPGSNKHKLVAYGRFITPAALWAVGACHPPRGPSQTKAQTPYNSCSCVRP